MCNQESVDCRIYNCPFRDVLKEEGHCISFIEEGTTLCFRPRGEVKVWSERRERYE
jgi:hypothetical protein